ncbi:MULTISPECIES: AAA family ATPase [Corynebacterium]|uniref:AAA family ATPase n=1 Tax=Corynebacterium coyleae TaxID=53374 RepID=A0AAP6XKJ1_9CORY|nr:MULTISPECIES: ATP-binding protein [Corynebacterium]NJJ02993.1 AAA family ATPase [Corynebacterium coyleae]
MDPALNPFRASLGSSPPLLVGRDEVIEDFSLAIEEGPGAHERISLLVGARGIGKTALLNELEDVAAHAGWKAFSETATEGFVSSLKEQLAGFLHKDQSTKTSWQIGPSTLRLKREVSDAAGPASLRAMLTAVLDQLADLQQFNKSSGGLLVTVDELHHVHHEEIVEFATAIQHLVRENRNIAVVLAGIPSSIRPLLASDEGRNPITFLRRANRVDLGRLTDTEVRAGLEVPVVKAGYCWDQDALNEAVHATGGYPFMIQLIGNFAWRFEGSTAIGREATEKAITRARKKLGQLVHEPALNDLSSEDRRFLAAMSLDEGPSKITDIARRLEVSDQQAYNYRRRLYEADMITNERGTADFSLPYLREYLRDHVVADILRVPEDEYPELPNGQVQQKGLPYMG